MATHPERRQVDAATNGLRASAAIDQLDATARSMEARWGVGRLRLLVDLDLAARFDRQRDRLRHAIAADDPTLIVTHYRHAARLGGAGRRGNRSRCRAAGANHLAEGCSERARLCRGSARLLRA